MLLVKVIDVIFHITDLESNFYHYKQQDCLIRRTTDREKNVNMKTRSRGRRRFALNWICLPAPDLALRRACRGAWRGPRRKAAAARRSPRHGARRGPRCAKARKELRKRAGRRDDLARARSRAWRACPRPPRSGMRVCVFQLALERTRIPPYSKVLRCAHAVL